ncbi:MAG: DUF1194 domain-containing protein [Bauldia sp.]
MPGSWMKGLRLGAAALALAGLAGSSSAQRSGGQMQVDLALVLAVDISGSMDFDEQRVQRDGYADAFRHPEVITAIRDGLIGKIAVTYVGWAGVGIQIVQVPWTIVEDKASAYAFADKIAKMPLGTYRGTSISDSLLFSAAQFDVAPVAAMKRTIDMSGDGPNNQGAPVLPVRDAVLKKGININGLPIMVPGHDASGLRDLDIYYRDCVIGGPSAFLFTIKSLEEFPTAIRRKLIQEIAYEPPPLPRDAIAVIPAQAQQGFPPAICAERPLFFQP